MKNRQRFLVYLFIAVVIAAMCDSYIFAGEKDKKNDKSRDKGRVEQKAERKRDHIRRDDARHRNPPPRYDKRRHPGRDAGYHTRDWDQYHWRHEIQRKHYPRSYHGLRLFDRPIYRGYRFGPHHRLWYRDGRRWRDFYWPYPYAPAFSCGWYWVPTARLLFVDPDTGQEFFDYTDYRYLRICFD